MDKTLYDDILYLESLFLSFGAERMSKYFGDNDFEKNIPAFHTLWDKDECYYMIFEDPLCLTNLVIKYKSGTMKDYKILKTISRIAPREQLQQEILEIMEGWTPEEEALLSQYIDLSYGTHLYFDIKKISFYTNLRENSFEFFSWNIPEQEHNFFDYEMNLCPELDCMYDTFYKALNYENDATAHLILCELYIKCCDQLGADHPNSMSLLYDFTLFFSEKVLPENLLQIYLRLYHYQKELHGNTHINTLEIITSIARLLCRMEKYKDSILLYKFVHRASCKKHGKYSSITLRAYSNLILPYYCFGHHGKALHCAEKCLENSEQLSLSERIFFKQWIALIHRESHFKSCREEALKYDLETLSDLKSIDSPDYFLILRTMNNICIDYLNLEQFSEAFSMESLLLETASKYIEPMHEDILNFKEDFIVGLFNNDQRELALNMAHAEYIYRKNILGKEHESTLELLYLYEDFKNDIQG